VLRGGVDSLHRKQRRLIFRREFLDGIRRGAITLAFRRWRRPTVRGGGTLGTLQADPRVALRESALADGDAVTDLRDRLRRLDARAPDGPWTTRTLEVLRAHPGVRAGDLCRLMGQARDVFKGNAESSRRLG
jgi:hypothetical protein